jgi:dTDP-4-dehydrorhamnose reductase
MRILIIGKNGQVGWELTRTMAPMGDLIAIDFPEVDLCDEAAVRSCVRNAKPDILVNAAAYTAVDKAEAEPEKATLINGIAPGILASEAAKSDALLVHYSTDYVYDGTTATSYTEDEKPNPQNAYGRGKLAGDQAVMASGCKHLIFRLCWVYGSRGQNFMRTIMRLASEREQLKVVADQTGCPTWSRMIAETTALAVHTVSVDSMPGKYYGLYHLAASGETSWHGFAQRIVDLMPATEKKCSLIQPISTSEYPLPARRPARSVLNCAKLEKTFGLRLPDWAASLQKVLEP